MTLELPSVARVLIIEDDPVDQRLVQSLLSNDARLTLTIASSLDEARALLTTSAWDVVLLDRRLPGGWTPEQVIRHVARWVGAYHGRVVVYSDDAGLEQVLQSIQAGATRHLIKGDGTVRQLLPLGAVVAAEALTAQRQRAAVAKALAAQEEATAAELAALRAEVAAEVQAAQEARADGWVRSLAAAVLRWPAAQQSAAVVAVVTGIGTLAPAVVAAVVEVIRLWWEQ